MSIILAVTLAAAFSGKPDCSWDDAGAIPCASATLERRHHAAAPARASCPDTLVCTQHSCTLAAQTCDTTASASGQPAADSWQIRRHYTDKLTGAELGLLDPDRDSADSAPEQDIDPQEAASIDLPAAPHARHPASQEAPDAYRASYADAARKGAPFNRRPVPELSTWAMLLAGLACVAALTRTRTARSRL